MHVLRLLWVSILLAAASGTGDMHRNGPLQMPLPESRLCTMIVKSDKNMQLEFSDANNHKRKFIVSFAMDKYDNETQIEGSHLGDNTAIVSRDNIELKMTKDQYISIFRKNNVVAVYRAGLTRPLLVYEYKGSEKIDFVTFNVWYHTGPRGRSEISIPAVGPQGERVKTLATPHGKMIRKELEETRREMYRRLRILGTYLQMVDIEKLTKKTLLTLKSILDNDFAYQLGLLDYYGIKMKDKYDTQRDTLFTQTRPKINARLDKMK